MKRLTHHGLAAGMSIAFALSCGGSSGEAAPEPPAALPDASTEEVPPGCDESVDPKNAPQCVVSPLGVFVDGARGSDANAGTKEAPVKTIGAALAKQPNKPRIFVCEGRYAEHVKVLRPVLITGGFACGSWEYTGAVATVAPDDRGYALEVRGVPALVAVSDLKLVAKDALDPGESSIAVFVASSAVVRLLRVSVNAGKGAAGANGLELPPLRPQQPPEGSRELERLSVGMTNPLCPTSAGGAGGRDGAPRGGRGLPVIEPALPDAASNGAGGIWDSANPNKDALAYGASGSSGAPGTSGLGAVSHGLMTSDGWRPADGKDGGPGGLGQGGGGGAQGGPGTVASGGGAGGCGGAGGKKGGGGGASIGVALFQAFVALDVSSISTTSGGAGGRGGKGQVGQVGQKSVDPPVIPPFHGGPGGYGGYGGGGGGGAGGLSVGVFYSGVAPSMDGVVVPDVDVAKGVTVVVAAASGGRGGRGGAADDVTAGFPGANGTDGVAGVSKAVMAAP